MGMLKARVNGKWEPVGVSSTDRWNTAWGVVAYASKTADQTGIPANVTTDVTGLSVTFTPVPGRRYRTSISFLGLSSGASFVSAIIADGSSTQVQSRNHSFSIASYLPIDVDVIESNLPAVATTRKARIIIGAGTVDALGGALYPAFISIEDIGPIAGAVAIPNPTPAWITPTLLNGWVNLGGIHTVAAYRIVGDQVQLRGRVQNGTAGQPIFVLPVGYRPTAVVTMATAHIAGGNWVFGVVEIDGGGNTASFGTTGTQQVSLNNLSFSVTP